MVIVEDGTAFFDRGLTNEGIRATRSFSGPNAGKQPCVSMYLIVTHVRDMAQTL